MIKKFIILTAFIMAVATCSIAQTGEMSTYNWTAPTTGTPASTYIIEVSQDNGPFAQVAEVDTNSYTFYTEALVLYIVRVAGKDAFDNIGPYSEASDPLFLDYGPPSAPGKPFKVN